MAARRKLRVIHTVDQYLATTTNWIYRLLFNLPDTQVVIAAKAFLKCGFYTDKFEYVRFPWHYGVAKRWSVFSRASNFFAWKAHRAYPWYVSKVARNIDLIHSHFAPCAWVYLPLAKQLGVPHVVSYYGYDYEHLPYYEPVWHERYKVLFQAADMFLCEGTHGAAVLERIGCPKKKIRVVRLGLEPQKIPHHKRQKNRHSLKLLQIASYLPKKGHIYTVQAFQEALKECPNMSLTLVGRESEFSTEEITKKIGALLTPSARAKVFFMEKVDYEQLYSFMADYDVFIHPSCYTEKLDCEGGAPVVLLDAQATGMPVIATTHCDIPEEVIHGETGLLSPEKDVNQLAESIKRFYEMSPDEYQQFSIKARQHVEAKYDVAVNAAYLREVYEELTMASRPIIS